jgi:hypothetical protein
VPANLWFITSGTRYFALTARVIKFSLWILLKFSAVLTSQNILIEKVISTLPFDVCATVLETK